MSRRRAQANGNGRSEPREPRYLTAKAVARWLGVSRRTVHLWWDMGELPYVLIAHRRRVTVAMLEEWDARRRDEMRESCDGSRNGAR